MKKTMSILAVAGLVLALASAAQAAIAPVDSVTTSGSILLETITVDTDVYDTDDMVTGTSTGDVVAGGGEITDMDNFDLNSQCSPDASTTWNTVWAENLVGAEFFIFEGGGNDALSVKAIFADDSTGQSVTLTTDTAGPGYNWGDTGVTMTAGIRSGQNAYGLTFSYGDLKTASGVNLTNQEIKGLQFSHDGVDPASVSAYIPEPATMSVLAIGGLAMLRRRKRA